MTNLQSPVLFYTPFQLLFRYGSKINFNDKHLNKASQGVVSTEQCGLPARPTARPTYAPPPTARPTYAPQTTTTTTTTKKPTYAPPTTTTTTKSTGRPPYIPPTTTTTTTSSTGRPPLIRPDIAFNGNSVVQLRDDLLNLNRLNQATAGTVFINMEFTTTSSNSLLLWQGERTEGFYDYDLEGAFLGVASKLIPLPDTAAVDAAFTGHRIVFNPAKI